MEQMELDRAADAFLDCLFDTERIDRQDAAMQAAPAPADLLECSRRHLEWLQRETSKQFHRHMALQAECEWVAAQAKQLAGAGPVGSPPADRVGSGRRRRRGRGGGGAKIPAE
jgi:hypothetical protein